MEFVKLRGAPVGAEINEFANRRIWITSPDKIDAIVEDGERTVVFVNGTRFNVREDFGHVLKAIEEAGFYDD